MTGLDIEAIRRRLDWLRACEEQCQVSPGQVSLHGYAAAAIECGRDVPVLLAEVERDRAAAKRVTEGAKFRSWTPDERTESGHTVRVKRACNGCGTLIGDVTEAEIEAGINGFPQTDVRAECPACNGDLWSQVLVALADEQGSHAMTLSNFEVCAESWLEERTRMLDRYARLDAEAGRLRGWNDELKAERDDLARRCLHHEGEMREAGAELRDAQAALADALQVIADLRGETT